MLERARRNIETSVSSGNTLGCSQLFVAIMRLRILCNLGRVPDLTKSTICNRCSGEDSSAGILIESLSVCPDCGRPLLPPDSNNEFGSSQMRETYGGALEMLRQGDQSSPQSAASGTIMAPGIFSTKLLAVVNNILSGESGGKQ